jgi:hypothetical protein
MEDSCVQDHRHRLWTESSSEKQSSDDFFLVPNSRITAKAPYQVNSSVGAEASKADKPWLGLGQEGSDGRQAGDVIDE